MLYFYIFGSLQFCLPTMVELANDIDWDVKAI